MRRVALALACTTCGPSAYVCTDNDECTSAGAVGVCQPDGHCSFPDDECPSGQRYGEHGGAMAGQCVAETADTGTETSTSTSSATTSTSIDTTIDPVSSSTTPVTVSSSSTTDVDPTTDTSAASSSSDATTEGPVTTPPLLWFGFDAVIEGGLVNSGSLGGMASCAGAECPELVEGIVGGGARFDGVEDCAIFEHVPELGGLTSLTIAAWVQRDVVDADYDCLLCKPAGLGAWNSWRLATYDDDMTGPLLDFRVGTGDNSGVSIASGMSIGTWVHAVGVWDGAKMVLWIDGEIANEYDNDLYEDDGQAVFLGCDDDHGVIGFTNYLTGALDEVQLYDRAISDDEITALFAEAR